MKAVDSKSENVERHRRKNARNFFSKGFVEGFGSVGFVLAGVGGISSQSSLLSNLKAASAAERQMVIRREKRLIVARYLGTGFANRFSTPPASDREHYGPVRDAFMRRRDFANAIRKQNA